ncbi:aminoacyl-tRNA hydrolase [Seonamhaeicola sediminis]|uniref:Aminoacyl-tRNA hydrolase n=1 Tax=Seonamhaeicola sediminis TaxID=2528206 RepID=A0A562YAA8_9FLAO|nr:alternative ribosome rescue aminoacyl-tRNA hydrolase ArfB [Seonamhaeicola sediminis]TWO31361.1 aminoacyl-tRNA hydrolase [Seonamhaeicola sediminis]
MFNKEALLNEVSLKAIKSSGSGGQHVNKVATKVELSFSINETSVLSEEQKQKLLQKLKKRLTKEGVLILQCGETRSQLTNKTLVINRFLEIIKNALIVKKKRIPTKTPKAIIRKRLKEKQKQAKKKANRRKPDID